MKKRQRKKLLSLMFKMSLSFLLITIVLNKIDIDSLKKLLKTANPLYFVAGFFLVTLSQLVGGLRMRYYLNSCEFVLSKTYSVCMYYIGTLFNIVLPGGIGGDGYKAFYFHKRFRFPWTKTILAILRGRASGLFFLSFFLISFAFFYREQLTMIPYTDTLLIVALVLIFPAYSICARIFLKEKLLVQLGALKYSFCIQSLHLVTITFILYGIGIEYHLTGYILVFLIANIVAVIPISFGGIGLREFTFVVLAEQMGLSSDIGVAASFLFYILYTGVALTGFVPYLMLKKLDLNELKYQRKISNSKFCIVEEKSEEALEAANATERD